MALTSQVRLRQLNTQELTGFLTGALPTILASTGIQVGGNIIPTASGLYNVGGTGLYYQNIYTNQLTVPSGSGINFGPNVFTAFTSGGGAVLKLNNFTITSSSQGLSIIGPQGIQGIQGPTGATGVSGIGVTGYSNVNNKLVLYFSNGASGAPINLPSGATGATGAYTTGFYQSGNYLSPIFSNGGTGSAFFIPSGGLGPQGPIGNIYIDMQQLFGFHTGDIAPYVTIPYINPTITENPPINLVKGMSYGFGYSGLATSVISGNNTNIFVDDFGQTGYLQLVFFNNSAIPGRYVMGEAVGTGYATIANWLDTSVNPISSSKTYSNYLNSLSMNVNFTADDNYYYGFQRYAIGNLAPIDDSLNAGEWGFYVLGQVTANYFGPPGPSGQQGSAGVPGPQGDIGPAGNDGQQGVGITGVYSNGTSIQLLFSNQTTSQWITLPSGGPSGSIGLTGPQGPSGLQGPIGPSGLQGYADTYFAEFYPNDMVISGLTGFYKQVSGASTWTQCIGTGRVCQPGDKIWFTTPSLVGKAYSPWQSMIFADDNFSTARYFYASVVSFNRNNGELQCVVSNTPSPAGLVSSYIQLYNYSLIDTNLGGLGSSGAIGPVGPQGPMGNTGHSIFINTSSNMSAYSTTNINPGSFDSWNLGISGEAQTINIQSAAFATGQTLIIKVRNTGVFSDGDYSNHSYPLLFWQLDGSSGIRFPNNVPAPAPDPNTSSVYTFIRFPNQTGVPLVLCTFSTNYFD